MIHIDYHKYFFLGKYPALSTGSLVKLVEYNAPFGPDEVVDCGQVGQILSAYSDGSEILTAP